MDKHFKTIGLIGKANHEETMQTVNELYQFLINEEVIVIVDEQIEEYVSDSQIESASLVDLGKRCDLAIVVGGDGNMLGAARVLSRFDVAVIGVNRGNLGFLTDLDPENFKSTLKSVIAGEFKTEMRFLLDVSVHRHQTVKASNSAVNEVVLHADKIAHMIEFEAYINNSFVFHQRSDGLIVSTPTGSTAYSLSGGGPIVHPDLNAISLIPMFPHTLSSRPLVVDADSEVRIVVSNSNDAQLQISCDSHIMLSVMPGDEVIIKKHPLGLRLIHPVAYDYYDVLRKKLNWGRQNY
ncbi:NAD(+) kinase [Psychrosphaera haliotis]|uniref:NAD kinase n=1 Tax=Psychrosphaera haliotis TaxID=555083 RepID=A0A6N8F9G8_9GAMM|nr:NAD(+) kinase [Psychrosphaera haliotis]MUH72908.1 NAD(+) kinase [Psychrosphaera haliotis]